MAEASRRRKAALRFQVLGVNLLLECWERCPGDLWVSNPPLSWRLALKKSVSRRDGSETAMEEVAAVNPAGGRRRRRNLKRGPDTRRARWGKRRGARGSRGRRLRKELSRPSSTPGETPEAGEDWRWNDLVVPLTIEQATALLDRGQQAIAPTAELSTMELNLRHATQALMRRPSTIDMYWARHVLGWQSLRHLVHNVAMDLPNLVPAPQPERSPAPRGSSGARRRQTGRARRGSREGNVGRNRGGNTRGRGHPSSGAGNAPPRGSRGARRGRRGVRSS